MSREFTFGLTLKDFMKRCKELGLPASRNAVINWEKQGWIHYSKTLGGWRKFDSMDDIDAQIKKIADMKGIEVSPKKVDSDIDFGVK